MFYCLAQLTFEGFRDPKETFRDPKGYTDHHLRTTVLDDTPQHTGTKPIEIGRRKNTTSGVRNGNTNFALLTSLS